MRRAHLFSGASGGRRGASAAVDGATAIPHLNFSLLSFPETPEVSELEIALLFPLCVASFAAFLFALSPRLYCEGVDEMGDIISFDLQICSS
tara:strand:+ start:325 stop:600 length:276 start_codon:yes stop_codon:yes gene_type:complete